MSPIDRSNRALARRLRDLREGHWPDLRITQQQVAEALGGDKPLSESLISSWESSRHPVAPPRNRLAGYARFFATRRSVADGVGRLLDDHELTDEERAARDALHTELLQLRDPEEPDASPLRVPLAAPTEAIGGGTWYFPDQRRIVIVCAGLPPQLRGSMPYADPADPDYVKAYTYADLDSLIELHGHIRAVNPGADVRIRRADSLEEDDYTSHLVLLGGVDWNVVTKDIVRRLRLPVRQRSRTDDALHAGGFETAEKPHQEFSPVIEDDGGRITLVEDVAHFFRGVNPYNSERTVTICNGMYGRGTYGAVRALTDASFRDRNEAYVAKRFGESPCFSLMMRVTVSLNGEALTPDWTLPETRLHEWPEAPGTGS